MALKPTALMSHSVALSRVSLNSGKTQLNTLRINQTTPSLTPNIPSLPLLRLFLIPASLRGIRLTVNLISGWLVIATDTLVSKWVAHTIIEWWILMLAGTVYHSISLWVVLTLIVLGTINLWDLVNPRGRSRGESRGVHREQVHSISKKIVQKDRDTLIEQSL